VAGVAGGAMGHRHHRADAASSGVGTPHHPHERQQATMQDDKLLTKYPPDNKPWFDQNRQVG
jgi:hypothetical protein